MESVKYNVKLSRRARSDLYEIIEYFETKVGSEVADDFTFRFDSTIQTLLLYPDIGSKRFKNLIPEKELCYFIISKFKHYVFYSFDVREGTILIERVLDSRRNIFKILDN